MKILKASELFLGKDVKPFLLGCLYSRIISINDNKYFVTTGAFKSSKYVFESDFNINKYKRDYLDVINYYSGYQYWFYRLDEDNSLGLDLPRADYLFVIENDLNQTVTTFFRSLLSKIYSSSWINDDSLTEAKKQFMRGYMEMRGSIDTKRPFITQDYFYNSKSEISKSKLLFDFLNIPIYVANINFRELQKEFVTNKNKRNTQFRIDLNWYSNNIGFFNKYKAKIFENKYYHCERIENNGVVYFVSPQRDSQNRDTFVRYLNYFANNVVGYDLSANEIEHIRSKLGFSYAISTSTGRNKEIIDIFRELSEDKCAICNTTKTYTNSHTGRQHFEIHHMISYKNGKELDVIDNLVKLCPTCHAMMKKSSGLINDQLAAIKKILIEINNVYEFCSTYLGKSDLNELASQIRAMLG